MVYCLEQDIDKQMTSVSCSQQISCLVKLLFKLDFKCMLCAFIHMYMTICILLEKFYFDNETCSMHCLCELEKPFNCVYSSE